MKNLFFTKNKMRQVFLLISIVFIFIFTSLHAEGFQDSVHIGLAVSACEAEEANTAYYATDELYKEIKTMMGTDAKNINLQYGVIPDGKGGIRMTIADKSQNMSSESFRIKIDTSGAVTIEGADPVGLLWGVRDFTHYYAKDWLDGLSNNKFVKIDFFSAPTIKTRGFWSWWYGNYDPYAYIDRASQWKINTVCFWNRGTPLDAERLVEYAHERGVKIWWGFGWGWNEGDFKDASPELAKKLMSLHERQTARIGAKPASLCPSDPETPQAMMDYVLDVFKNQYSWLPYVDGIYFQTATEAVCPCNVCKSKPLGETLMPVILPILEEMHRKYPNLKISWGVHNRENIQEYETLKQVPNFVNLCWEAGLNWAYDINTAKQQMKYRGDAEDYAGVYRIVMNCGLQERGESIRGEPSRNWLPRIDAVWRYLEEGLPPNLGTDFRVLMLGQQEIASACTSNWGPSDNGSMIENKNLKEFREWAQALEKGVPEKRGIFLLLENGMIELKMRRVAAITSELIWNPSISDAELEHRCEQIWEKKVGGWEESLNPYWNKVLEVRKNETKKTALDVIEK